MKERNIIRTKCITILLFIILSVVLIVAGFLQEYRSSSPFNGDVGGPIVSLCMLRTMWLTKASWRKHEQLIIDEAGEHNLPTQKSSRVQVFDVSLITALTASVLVSSYHEEAISSCFNILLSIRLFTYLLIWMYYKGRLWLSVSQTCRMELIIGTHTQSSKAYHIRSSSCRAAPRVLPVYKLIGCLYTGSFARLHNTLYSPKKMVL